MAACISCASKETLDLVSVDRVPVLCNELHDSADSARRAPTGRLDLSFCKRCGHYYNRSFDPGLMYYSPDYETSLYASAVFQEYAGSLTQRLINRYDIRNKRVLEIGCGRGEFLRQLCRAGNNTGLGFDTSTPYIGEHPDVPGVTYVRDYFSERYDDVRADLIVCQQVLEHIPEPQAFLAALAATKTFRSGRPVTYFEVPNGLYTTRDLGVWDLIYEHVSYFTPTSLQRIFQSAGFEILEIGTAYGGQYLYVDAQPATRVRTPPLSEPSADDIRTAELFAGRFSNKLEAFREWALDSEQLGRTYVWGAGSKGITFCNLVDPDARIAGLIDRNVAKHGKYIGGTGIRISGLEDIPVRDIAVVVVMNPQYTQEIASECAMSRVTAKVVAP